MTHLKIGYLNLNISNMEIFINFATISDEKN